ncbi:uroporphyrinogen-III C-methyltransferase [Cellulomonas marina]|uniref:Uroporphyrin-III C-methyltransferase / precorrin-2 dehydrogenase / sirohydrochlorin ferrochelatase n=1 Tax=Cellulomonas marina TaxID=988821 RepID=A0A1I0W585_9CELL|nr:uroporphyrinogen-III C-methyltransferase [Cellulomonas marina]GIG29987.1 uroporphyrinogen-III C-methyltransferase [Cellulomonas marina]SFA83507.1 uroporphyrin-III C-methyltransferase / precorrin-2 dehydrogenase / sirohydrochlorin ferrochelatase [Cellulomonas marina]
MTTLLGLELAGRRVLVVGGGPVAARRAEALLADGAEVLVVAPELCEALAQVVRAGRVTWRAERVRPEHLDDAWLVHTATGVPAVDEAVVAWAAERRTFCVDAGGGDRPAAGTARTPATARRDGLLVGVVSTGGADPRRSVAVRDALLGHLDTGAVDLRRRRGPRPGQGRVVLVGGGPGDPGLLTRAGRRALAEADVVVTDRLGPVAVLDELPPGVEVVDVGKRPGHHPVPQAEIGRLLVDRALAGHVVVRLKGGDPFVFGRGGEEVVACREAGVPVEVVAGVSSALAAPTAAGIPLTHRGTVGAFLVMNGHDGWSEAALTGLREETCTVVVLMGVAVLPELVAGALAVGVAPDLPVAVVENATLPGQRVTRSRLDAVVAAAQDGRVHAPAVLVLGRVAADGLLDGTVAAAGVTIAS